MKHKNKQQKASTPKTLITNHQIWCEISENNQAKSVGGYWHWKRLGIVDKSTLINTRIK